MSAGPVVPFRSRADVPRGMPVLRSVSKSTWATAPVYFEGTLTLDRIAQALASGGLTFGWDEARRRVLIFDTAGEPASGGLRRKPRKRAQTSRRNP